MTFIGTGRLDIFFRFVLNHKMIILTWPYIVMIGYHIHFARKLYEDEHTYEKETKFLLRLGVSELEFRLNAPKDIIKP